MEPIPDDIDPAVLGRRWIILVVLCLSLMIVIIGNTSLNVAIPVLARELEASTSELQWIVDAYSLVFAGLLFAAGTAGDRYGRKGVLQGGLVLFLISAAVATLAEDTSMLIASRAVMGVGAALVMPATLSILTNVFPAHERPRPSPSGPECPAAARPSGPSCRGGCSSTSGGARSSSSTCP